MPHQEFKIDVIICPRCGDPFVPKPTKLLTIKFTRFCETCLVKNLFDLMALPTPPELLDKHTVDPCITEEIYFKKLKEKNENHP